MKDIQHYMRPGTLSSCDCKATRVKPGFWAETKPITLAPIRHTNKVEAFIATLPKVKNQCTTIKVKGNT